MAYSHPDDTYRGVFAFKGTDGAWHTSTGPLDPGSGVDRHWVGRYNGDYLQTVLDGTTTNSNHIGAYTIQSFTGNLIIGANNFPSGTPDSFCAATIYEVRLSSVFRTEAWLKASYHSLCNTLLGFGDVEAYGGTVALEDALLDLRAYYQWLEDVLIHLNATAFSFENLPADLRILGLVREDLLFHFIASRYRLTDLKSFLKAVSGEVLSDFSVFLSASDGMVTKDCRMFLTCVEPVPESRHMVFQRLSPVMKEV